MSDDNKIWIPNVVAILPSPPPPALSPGEARIQSIGTGQYFDEDSYLRTPQGQAYQRNYNLAYEKIKHRNEASPSGGMSDTAKGWIVFFAVVSLLLFGKGTEKDPAPKKPPPPAASKQVGQAVQQTTIVASTPKIRTKDMPPEFSDLKDLESYLLAGGKLTTRQSQFLTNFQYLVSTKGGKVYINKSKAIPFLQKTLEDMEKAIAAHNTASRNIHLSIYYSRRRARPEESKAMEDLDLNVRIEITKMQFQRDFIAKLNDFSFD